MDLLRFGRLEKDLKYDGAPIFFPRQQLHESFVVEDIVFVQGAMFPQSLGSQVDPTRMKFKDAIHAFLGDFQNRGRYIR